MGQGLGKDGDGIVEPVKVWRKSDKRGIGGESSTSGRVVGEDTPRARDAAKTDKARARIGKGHGGEAAAVADDDDDVTIVDEKKGAALAAHALKEARERAIASSVFRAFKEEEPGVDMNPLLRRRREREEVERRNNKRKREAAAGGGGGDGDDGGMSANNPLRGLFG